MSSEQDSIINIGDPLIVIHTTQLFTCLVLLGISFGNTVLVSLLFYLQFSEPQHRSHIYIQKYTLGTNINDVFLPNMALPSGVNEC